MSRTSHSYWLATLTLSTSVAILAHAAAAASIHRAQYEVYNDQQTTPREPASDQQTVASQETPSELQPRDPQQQSGQPSASPPSSYEQKGEQAAAPQSPPEQPNAFVSGKSDEPQDVAQTEPQSSEQSKAQGKEEQKSSEPSQSQPTPSSETKPGENGEPNNQ